MRAQEPDPVAARALFTELEFTTLVQDFLTESIELGETDYREAKSAADVEAVLALARKSGAMLAIALESSATEPAAQAEAENPDEAESEQLSLTAAALPSQPRLRSAIASPSPPRPAKR